MSKDWRDLVKLLDRYWHNRVLDHFQVDVRWSTKPGALQTICDCRKVWRWERGQ